MPVTGVTALENVGADVNRSVRVMPPIAANDLSEFEDEL